jgi:hypothetical protein
LGRGPGKQKPGRDPADGSNLILSEHKIIEFFALAYISFHDRITQSRELGGEIP